MKNIKKNQKEIAALIFQNCNEKEQTLFKQPYIFLLYGEGPYATSGQAI